MHGTLRPLNSGRPARSRLRLSLAIIAVGLALIFWMAWRVQPAGPPASGAVSPAAIPAPVLAAPPSARPVQQAKTRPESVGPVSRKGVWRLAPGETGLLSYVSEKNRTNGVMLVTLDADAEGKLTLQRREFYVLDSALPASGLKPYMPGIYEFERFDTLSPAQAQALLKSLEHADGVSNHGSGHSWGPPGHPRNGTSTLRSADGQLILRENLKILAHEADAQGRYQVDVELISEHGPASLNQSLQPDDEP